MLQRFLGPTDGSLLQRLFTVKQNGLVADCRAQFELLAASIGQLDEATLTAVFTNGLEDQVRAELLLLIPKRLKETMKIATKVE